MRIGSHHTAETKAKISAAKKDPSPETLAKMSAASLGRKPSSEARAKTSAALMGNTNSLGHEHSPETRAKIRTARRGPNYRANKRYCAKVYENAWGQIPREENGHGYNIHHRDGNRQNDDPENLIALTNSEHSKLERALRRGDWDLASEIDAIGESRRQT